MYAGLISLQSPASAYPEASITSISSETLKARRIRGAARKRPESGATSGVRPGKGRVYVKPCHAR
jgi:hypothetical protein